MKLHPALLGFAVLAGGCRAAVASHAGWSRLFSRQGSPAASPLPVLSDRALKPFLPATLLGEAGGPLEGSMMRMGPRALSEVTRVYGKTRETEIKLADARFEPRATDAIRAMADGTGAEEDAERLVLPGAIGYARFDEDDRVAEAKVVVGGRLIASATVREAEDAQTAAAALRALDTLALARLAQQEGRETASR